MNSFARIACIFASIGGSASVAAAPQSAPSLKPTGKWLVEFADAMCVASREFGTPAKPMTLVFKPSPFGREMRLMIVRGGISANPVQTRAIVTLENGATMQGAMTTYSPIGKALRIHAIQLKEDNVVALRQSATVIVASRGGVDASFAVPGMARAMLVLDECVANLAEQWGMSRDEQKRMKEYPQSLKPLSEYVSDSDYPAKALRDSRSGRTGILLRIDSIGAITDCTVVEASGSSVLDEASCRLLRTRAKFKPATDQDGKPMNSLMVTAINWITG